MPHDPYRALYIHVPFCTSKCNYCDFHSYPLRADSPRVEKDLEEKILEIRRLSKEGELSDIDTIYIGGGTPSYVGSRYLSNLLYTLGVSLALDDVSEITMEANPESLDERLIKDVWALGVNRLSLGVQTLDDGLLELLGRAHDAEDSKHAIEAALTRFDNVSVDLMCGIPGQTIGSFERDLHGILEYPIKHISIYPLTIESHTPFEKMLLSGRLRMPDDDHVAEMMEFAADTLHDKGFKHYEVSNYALDGYESKHNMAYWKGIPYLGIGESATTMTQNDERRMRVKDGMVVDDLDLKQMIAEDLMLGMRMSDGIEDQTIDEYKSTIDGLENKLDGLVSKGLLVHSDGAYRPTKLGWLCGNDLYMELLECGER